MSTRCSTSLRGPECIFITAKWRLLYLTELRQGGTDGHRRRSKNGCSRGVQSMYVVTGGAGFIGSNIVAALAARGEEIVVCDWLRSDERWRNISKHEIAALVAPEDMPAWLDRNASRVEMVIHMGADSSTTETNVDLIVAR